MTAKNKSPIVTRRRVLTAGGALTAGLGLSACGDGDEPPQTPVLAGFEHGVASGDPLSDRVILWTRISPKDPTVDRLSVTWQVAADADFARVVAQGVVDTGVVRDWTVKVDAAGLVPGTEYFYRFSFGEHTSPVGRTKTLAEGRLDRLRLAVFSCSNFPFGYFNAYRHFADGEPVDAVLHLGDYFYEYGPNGYGGEAGARLDRNHEPAREVNALGDYRRRHAQYKRDPDLQAAHAAAPWITIWDDHESANNAWATGAENHNPDQGEGEWSARKSDAVRAYLEWMPIREPQAGRAREAIWRRFEFGDLATLIMLETRLTARSPEISLSDLLVPVDAQDGDPEMLAEVNRFLRDEVGDPSRTLLGDEQLNWVRQSLTASREAGKPWQILGNQVILARVNAPNFAKATPFYVRELAKRDELAWAYFQLSRFNIPINLDSWDGFPAERERLYAAAKQADANLIAFTGDTHNFWANELLAQDGARMGSEFGTSSVTSPSAFERLRAPGLHAGRLVELANDDVFLHEPYDRGYLLANITREAVSVDYIKLSTVTDREFSAKVAYRFTATPKDGQDAGKLRRERV